jgi:hypothetical protein
MRNEQDPAVLRMEVSADESRESFLNHANLEKFSKRSFLQRDRSTVALAATPRKVVISSMQISTLLQITRLNENSFCHTGAPLQAWKLTPDASGKPNFNFAGQSAFSVGCHGTPTVTSQNGVSGTAIVGTLSARLQTIAHRRLSRSGFPTPPRD